MNATTNGDDHWEACRDGELRKMAERIGTRQRRRFLIRAGSAAAGAAAVGGGVLLVGLWLQRPAEYRYGGIACSEVAALIDDYRAEQLAPDVMRQISRHLDECPNCGRA